MTLTCNLLQQMFQATLLFLKENNCANLIFEIHAQMYKLWPEQIQAVACTHNAHTMHIHRTEVVTTMSCSPKVGSTKRNKLMLTITNLFLLSLSQSPFQCQCWPLLSALFYHSVQLYFYKHHHQNSVLKLPSQHLKLQVNTILGNTSNL